MCQTNNIAGQESKQVSDKIRCIDCGKEFNEKDVIIKTDGFYYCPLCLKPLFDITIQPKDSWVWKYVPEKLKKEWGYYD